MLELYPDSIKTLRRWLSEDAISTLAQRVSVIAKRPPPQVPTLKTAMEQLEQIDAAAKGLQTVLEGAPWTCDALVRSEPSKFSDALLLRRLADLRGVVRHAAADFPNLRAEGAALAQGNRADAMVRDVVRAVLQSLEAEGIPLAQTGTGAAAVCTHVILEGLATSDWLPSDVAGRFKKNAVEQVRAMLREAPKRTSKQTSG